MLFRVKVLFYARQIILKIKTKQRPSFKYLIYTVRGNLAVFVLSLVWGRYLFIEMFAT